MAKRSCLFVAHTSFLHFHCSTSNKSTHVILFSQPTAVRGPCINLNVFCFFHSLFIMIVKWEGVRFLFCWSWGKPGNDFPSGSLESLWVLMWELLPFAGSLRGGMRLKWNQELKRKLKWSESNLAETEMKWANPWVKAGTRGKKLTW